MTDMEIESTMSIEHLDNVSLFCLLETLPLPELFLFRRVSRRFLKVVNRWISTKMRTIFIPMMSLQQIKMMLQLLVSLRPIKLKVITVEAERIKSMVGKFPTLLQQTRAVFAVEDICYCQTWWPEIRLNGLESFTFDYNGLILNPRVWELMSMMPDLKNLTIRNINLATKFAGLDAWLLELLQFCPQLTTITLWKMSLYSIPIDFPTSSIHNIKRVYPKLRIHIKEDSL